MEHSIAKHSEEIPEAPKTRLGLVVIFLVGDPPIVDQHVLGLLKGDMPRAHFFVKLVF